MATLQTQERTCQLTRRPFMMVESIVDGQQIVTCSECGEVLHP